MMVYYFDTSAMVKYYISEPGTDWVVGVVDAQINNSFLHQVSLAEIGEVEVAAALAKKQRTREIGKRRQRQALEAFLHACQHRFQILQLDGNLIQVAIDLTQRHSLRGYDAVHLATALRLQESLVAADLPPIVFVAADRMLCDAAISEGLAVVNPNEIAVEGHSGT